MFYDIINLLLASKLYAITAGIIILFFILSRGSAKFYDNIKISLWVAAAIWLICFGIHLQTGRNVVYFTQSMFLDDGQVEQGAFSKYFSHSSVEDEEK